MGFYIAQSGSGKDANRISSAAIHESGADKPLHTESGVLPHNAARGESGEAWVYLSISSPGGEYSPSGRMDVHFNRPETLARCIAQMQLAYSEWMEQVERAREDAA